MLNNRRPSRHCARNARFSGLSSMRSTTPMCSRGGQRPAPFVLRSEPMPLENTSRPRLAAGCRWAGEGENQMVVFPEGALRLHDTARGVIVRCDRPGTFEQIVQEIEATYSASDPVKIRQDAVAFLERLRQKRLVYF